MLWSSSFETDSNNQIQFSLRLRTLLVFNCTICYLFFLNIDTMIDKGNIAVYLTQPTIRSFVVFNSFCILAVTILGYESECRRFKSGNGKVNVTWLICAFSQIIHMKISSVFAARSRMVHFKNRPSEKPLFGIWPTE